VTGRRVRYVLELYNLFRRDDGSKTTFPRNGWYIATEVDGRMMGARLDFRADEAAARSRLAELNGTDR
jgi:hypothetical protein